MRLDIHPDMQMRKLTIGAEKAPLLVIDEFVSAPGQLVKAAATMDYRTTTRYFPGIRAEAPQAYQRLVSRGLRDVLIDYFELRGTTLSFSMCHYSIVTTPPEKLVLLQRMPHIDSVNGNCLASIHYLFRDDLGGTSFYRHRATGFEYVDAGRQDKYARTLKQEIERGNTPGAAYINGDTPLFERIAEEKGLFNRVLFYKRNSLHSGSIASSFMPDPDPLTGRLSINSFIDVGP